MTERYGEPTRYLTFKLTQFAKFLEPYTSTVLAAIADEPEGITFDEIRERVHIGPKHLRAVLKTLFEKDYIITNRQIARLKEKYGIDAQRLRRGTVTVIEREAKPRTQPGVVPSGPGRRGPRAPAITPPGRRET